MGIAMLLSIFSGHSQSAAVLMQNSDFDGSKTVEPHAQTRLAVRFQPGLFLMIKGSIALARKDVEEGEKWLEKPKEVEVPTDNEKSDAATA